MIHGDLVGQNVHVPYSFEYSSATLRDSATGLITQDIGKLCRLTSDNTLWMLVSAIPVTWVGIASGVTNGSTSAVASAGATFPTTPVNYELFYRTDIDTMFVWNPLAGAWIDVTAANVGGDMFMSVYDPTNVNADAFAMDNMTQGITQLFMTPTEQSKLAGAEIVANKGIANGYPTLDANGEVVQLPSGAGVAAASAFLRSDGQWVLISGGAGGASSNSILVVSQLTRDTFVGPTHGQTVFVTELGRLSSYNANAGVWEDEAYLSDINNTANLAVYTQTQINALTPTDGLTVYNSTVGVLQYYALNSGTWVSIPEYIKKTTTVSSNVTLYPRYNYHVSIDGSLNPVTITIPDPSLSGGATFSLTAVDITFPVQVSIQNGLLDGSNLFTFAHQFDAITILSDGTQWRTIASDIKDIDVVVNTSNITNDIDKNIQNINMNSFRIMQMESMNKYLMVDGILDDLKTENYIDTVASSYKWNANAGGYVYNAQTNPAMLNWNQFKNPAVSYWTAYGSVQAGTLNPGGSNLGQTFKVFGTKVLTNLKLKVFDQTGYPFSGVGTGSLIITIIKLPSTMVIGSGTDKPSITDFNNVANQVGQVTMTEAEVVAALMPTPVGDLLWSQTNWFNIPLPNIAVTEGDYAFMLDQNTNPMSGWPNYHRVINSLHSTGNMLQIYSSGTTFNASGTTIFEIDHATETTTQVQLSNYPTAGGAFSNWNANVARMIPFRIDADTLIENVAFQMFWSPWFGNGSRTGGWSATGGTTNGFANPASFMKFSIQHLTTGGVTELTATKSWSGYANPVNDIISGTITEAELQKGLYNDGWIQRANQAAVYPFVAAHVLANGFTNVIPATTPTVLPAGEYVLVLDANNLPGGGVGYWYLDSVTDKWVGGHPLGRWGRYGSYNLFEINGKSQGVTSSLLLEGTANGTLIAPTKIYLSAYIDTAFALNTDIKAEVSRDNGVTWSVVTMNSKPNSNVPAGFTYAYGIVDISMQPTGTQVKYRFTTQGTAVGRIDGVSVQWR